MKPITTSIFEAVVNAVAHRDYSVRGAKIRLHMFADRLELVSPGSLPGTLTVDQMPYWQETRNEAICALLARCPMLAGVDGSTRKYLMDARGEGVPIIIARSERISGKKPEYRDIQGSGVMLTIPGFSDDLLTNSSENATASSEKMTVGEQILTMIATDASVTQVAIAKKLHCPRSTVAYWFKKFTDEGKIVRKGPDKGGRWLVKE